MGVQTMVEIRLFFAFGLAGGLPYRVVRILDFGAILKDQKHTVARLGLFEYVATELWQAKLHQVSVL